VGRSERRNVPRSTSRGETGRGADLVELSAWGAVGFAGYVGLALAGTRLGALPDPVHGRWWFTLPAGHHDLYLLVFYLSMAAAVAGWLGVGRQTWRGHLDLRRACTIGAVWSLPLFLGPPLFSKDIYSYIGQGTIAHRGLDPYSVGPDVLGKGPLLASIASVWRHTPAPYGPLFVAISRAVVAGAGRSLVVEVLVMRAVELVGMALIVASLHQLAKRSGVDPARALWLGALSPLVLFSFVASGHNDCLMVGLLVAGVTASLGGRRVVGLVLCALAASIKAPAAAGIVFLAAAQLRESRRQQIPAVVASVTLIPIATVTAVTLATGLGWRWLDLANLRIPTELRIVSTPSVSLGIVISRLLRLIRVPASPAGSITVMQALGAAIAVAGVLWLVLEVRRTSVVRLLAIALLLVVLTGPTLWPWYLTWGLVLLAASRAQQSRALAVVAGLAMCIVGPAGTPELSGYTYIAVSVAVATGAVWLVSEGRWTKVVLGRGV